MKTASIGITVSGSGYVSIYMKDNETLEDLNSLSDKELVSRILDFSDVFDNCIDDEEIEVNDVII